MDRVPVSVLFAAPTDSMRLIIVLLFFFSVLGVPISTCGRVSGQLCDILAVEVDGRSPPLLGRGTALRVPHTHGVGAGPAVPHTLSRANE